MSLPAILAAAHREPGRFVAQIPDTWLQGRTAYGGVSSALALECARSLVPDLPPLRSAQVAFVGPVFGEIVATAEVVRTGKNATWIRAQLEGAQGVVLITTFVFMRAMPSAIAYDKLAMPWNMSPEDSPEPKARAADASPNFFVENFEMRFAQAQRDGDPEPELVRWVKLKERAGLDPFVELLAIGDALPPGAMPLMKTWAPISSMTWQVGLLTDAPTTRGGWWMLRASTDYTADGCATQAMHIWNANGQAIASGTQSIAIFA